MPRMMPQRPAAVGCMRWLAGLAEFSDRWSMRIKPKDSVKVVPVRMTPCLVAELYRRRSRKDVVHGHKPDTSALRPGDRQHRLLAAQYRIDLASRGGGHPAASVGGPEPIGGRSADPHRVSLKLRDTTGLKAV